MPALRVCMFPFAFSSIAAWLGLSFAPYAKLRCERDIRRVRSFQPESRNRRHSPTRGRTQCAPTDDNDERRNDDAGLYGQASLPVLHIRLPIGVPPSPARERGYPLRRSGWG